MKLDAHQLSEKKDHLYVKSNFRYSNSAFTGQYGELGIDCRNMTKGE